ncbi:MAG: haloacid dehalogenase [Homoserinimonas sp.]|jgi:Cof subfamily protein (haloacid dehalogenase superfamily)|nr:haloacid dehalogenase [Homoserinimonas sp.]
MTEARETGDTMTQSNADDRLLIALDVDGTILLEDGTMTEAVFSEVVRLRDLGHEVMIATGRSVSMTLPVVERLGIAPEYLVCSNGAVTMRRDPDAPLGYTRAHVETFDPTSALNTIFDSLGDANYAVEDDAGIYWFKGEFPASTLGAESRRVEFEELHKHEATRVVVISPEHALDDFLTIVEHMGLHKVSYNIGWTAWLDIAPDGVNKATGMERVRQWLGVPSSRVVAVGDGRNDIEMLEWASREGRGVAMGQAPEEVKSAANGITGSDREDGLAKLLSTL